MDATDQILPDGPWLDRLNPAYLAAAYPGWGIGATDFEAAAAAFRRFGLAALAPLDAGLRFEPDYYREVEPAWENTPDADCYRHYLLEGLAAGQPGSAAAHLASLGLPATMYPSAFPWQYYARLRPQAGAHRWSALDDFCATGFRDFGDTWPFGPEAFRFLIELGQKFSIIDDAMAIRAYELAQTHSPLPAAEQQHLADAYLRREFWRPALQLYEGIIRAGAANGWTIRNFVTCASRLEDWPALLSGLDLARLQQADDRLWTPAVDEAATCLFNARQRAARLLMAQGAYAEADGHLAAMVAEIAGVIDRLRAASTARTTRKTRPVMLLANQDDAESAARYVTEKCRLLDLSGIPHEVHDCAGAPALTERLAGAQALILFRVPALPPVIQAVLAARRLGIPVFYESDVMLADSAAAPEEAHFGGMIPRAEYDDFRYGLALQRAAAGLCDYAIAPTERLMAALRPLTRSRRGFVLANSLLPEAAAAGPRPAGRVEIFLRARAAITLDDAAGSAGQLLLGLLQRWPEPVLRVSGPVRFAPCFDLHAGRLFDAGPAAVPADYWPALAGADVSFVIGGETPDGEYLAELGWREAAGLAVPAVLLVPDGRLPAIRDGANAHRAATAQALFPAFERLLGDPAPRRSLGARAARDAALLDGPEAAAQVLTALLAEAAAFKDGHARYP